jgi:imidazoleglycerol phosphate dehydratase HisB
VRRAVIDRRTTETPIAMKIDLDGKGKYRVRTGIRFLVHAELLRATARSTRPSTRGRI